MSLNNVNINIEMAKAINIEVINNIINNDVIGVSNINVMKYQWKKVIIMKKWHQEKWKNESEKKKK